MHRFGRNTVSLTGMRTMCSAILLCFTLTACGVGPGTPLIVALKRDKSQLDGNVPKPKGYDRPVSAGVSSGLINPADREETAEYLESLATSQ